MLEQKSYLQLLEESFPGIKKSIMRYETLGFSWEQGRVFLKEDKGVPVSHVSFFDCPILIEGKWHKMGALHAICTTTSYRGQGLASELIVESLQWAEKRCEFVILFTEIPEFYKKLGFRYLQEYRFHLACQPNEGVQTLRPVTAPEDNNLVLSCFRDRKPLSQRLWIKDNGNVATFNMLFTTYPTYGSLYYSPTIDGFISYWLEEKTLHLLDVVTAKIPSLDVILDHFSDPIENIYFYFSPDELTNLAVSEPYLYDNGYLMIHGAFPCIKPFMVSPLSRC